MQEEIIKQLEGCDSFDCIFSLVKELVRKTIGRDRAGLMLGLQNLGGTQSSWLGAYYPLHSNLIVMNQFPLKRLSDTSPELVKPYVFSILLHEYLHSLGFIDESSVRKLTFDISKRILGLKHIATEMALDITKFLPKMKFQNIDCQIISRKFI